MLETIISGGIMMVPLMSCSVGMIAVLFERGLAFYRNSRIDVRSLRANILTFIEQDKIDEAINLCASTRGPIAAVLLVGLQSYKKTIEMKASPMTQRELVEKAMEDYSPSAIHAAEMRLNWLSTFSNVAPLFGMTGTVTGMIRTFGSLGSAGTMDAGVVGAGIAEALVTTAAGLVIALVSVIPYNAFMNKVAELTLEIGESAAELVSAVVVRREQLELAQ